MTIFSLFILMSFSPVFISGCYTDTIDDFSKFNVQIPIHFIQKWRDKAITSVSIDSTNLNNYKEYTENKDKIVSAHFYQIGYWIDSVRVAPGDPPIDKITFDSVKYYLYYYDNLNVKSQEYLIASYYNVKVKDYYRIPHIVSVSDSVALLLEDVAKNHPIFYTVAKYSFPTSGGSGRFPYVDSRIDVDLRLNLEL